MSSLFRTVARRLAWLAVLACLAAPLAGQARDLRMDPAERERLREELRERYGEQRGREVQRRDRDGDSRYRFAPADAGGAEAAPRQRLSPEEMQVLRQQLREQRERPRGNWGERERGERGRGDGERGGSRRR